MNIELLKPYGDFAVGDVIDIDETIGQHLIDTGIAQLFEAQKEVADEDNEEKDDEVENEVEEKSAISKKVKAIENKLVKSATKTFEQIAKSLHKTNTVAATPKDKFNGVSGINEMFRMMKAAKNGNSYCQSKLKPFEVNVSAEQKNWAEGAKLAGIKTPAGQNFSTPADGGYAIPEEWSAKLSSKPMNIPDLVGMTSGESISGNYLHLPGFTVNLHPKLGQYLAVQTRPGLNGISC